MLNLQLVDECILMRLQIERSCSLYVLNLVNVSLSNGSTYPPRPKFGELFSHTEF